MFTHHVTFVSEFIEFHAFYGHPSDRKRAIFVFYFVVIIDVDIPCQTEVGNFNSFVDIHPIHLTKCVVKKKKLIE